MRNRFEQQYSIGHRLIKDTPINPKRKDKLEELIAALKAIYLHPEYNPRLFKVLERQLQGGKKETSRPFRRLKNKHSAMEEEELERLASKIRFRKAA